MEAPEELHGLARDGLRKIAARELNARGPRMDAVFYLRDPLRDRHAGKGQPLSLPVGDELRCISLNVSPTMELSIGEQEC